MGNRKITRKLTDIWGFASTGKRGKCGSIRQDPLFENGVNIERIRQKGQEKCHKRMGQFVV
jgi:hypothetical protein